MPFGMSHANRHDDVASHYGRFVSYGIAPRGLLYRLQLVVLRRALSARYDHRSDGSPHSHHIGGENSALAPSRFLHCRRGTCNVRRAVDCVTATRPALMSAFGPKQTRASAAHMSAFGGKADIDSQDFAPNSRHSTSRNPEDEASA